MDRIPLTTKIAGEGFRVFLAGDSTMQYNDSTTYPQTGWGQVFPLFLKENTRSFNFGKNGRSTKSFIAEGRLAKIDEGLEPGDYLIVQFSHNDEKIQDPSRYTEPYGEYTKNLAQFAATAVKHGAFPLFLTSITRRAYYPDGTVPESHGDYPAAMMKYAKSAGYPVIDVNTLSRRLLEKVGEQETRQFFMNFDAGLYPCYMDGKQDNTHMRYPGAFQMALLTAKEIARLGKTFPAYKPLSDAIILPKNEEIDSTER